jgi:hypothetical protein
LIVIPQMNLSAVVATSNWMKTPNAAGILLFNVVFHDIVPLVCQTLDYNVRKVGPLNPQSKQITLHLLCNAHRWAAHKENNQRYRQFSRTRVHY